MNQLVVECYVRTPPGYEAWTTPKIDNRFDCAIGTLIGPKRVRSRLCTSIREVQRNGQLPQSPCSDAVAVASRARLFDYRTQSPSGGGGNRTRVPWYFSADVYVCSSFFLEARSCDLPPVRPATAQRAGQRLG